MKYRNFVAILSFLSIFLLACEDEIPINEMTKARMAIDKALSVKAEDYAPEEYAAAVKNLSESHEKMVKDEDPDESIKSADESYKKAVEAYNKAVVLYAEALMKQADEAIAAADEVYAEKLAPESFKEAKDLRAGAGEKHDAKSYEEAIALAQSSYEKAVKAKEDAIDNKYQIQSMIDEANSRIARVQQYDYESYAPQQYNMAVENSRKAQSEYDGNKLKDAYASAEIALKNADDALRLTMDGVTGSKIVDAEDAINAAENSSGAEVAAEDLAAAKEALANAKQSRDQGYYEDSINYCNEAIRLANDVLEAGREADIAKVKADQDKADKEKADKEKADKEKADKEKADKDKHAKKRGEVIKEDENYYYYKVKSWEKYGDCLWRIAGEFYGNSRLWTKIHKANKDKIKNPDLIRPGWVLKIPKIKK